MISKTKIAYIRSLHSKSARYIEGVFIVEGRKCIEEFISSDFDILEGLYTEKFASNSISPFPITIVSDAELARMTTLKANDAGILIVRMRPNVLKKINAHDLILVLDTINDPGNLGTIIRIADWYGISQIIASIDTVDAYNSKVLMATMGSFCRISVFYTDIVGYLSKVHGKVYGAYLDGENVHTKNFATESAHLVIGSEAHGISPTVESYITDKITIPKFGSAESLNAGIATAVIVDRIIGSKLKI